MLRYVFKIVYGYLMKEKRLFKIKGICNSD